MSLVKGHSRAGRPRTNNKKGVLSVLAKNIEMRMPQVGIETLAELARLSNVSRTVLTNIYIDPHKTVVMKTGIKLAKTLNCRVEWLMTGEGWVSEENRSDAPLASLKDISFTKVEDDIEQLRRKFDTKLISCPTERPLSCFAVCVGNELDPTICTKTATYSKQGYLFFEHSIKPRQGDLVVIQASEQKPRIVEYGEAHMTRFIRELNDSIPKDLAITSIDDKTKIIGTLVGYSTAYPRS